MKVEIRCKEELHSDCVKFYDLKPGQMVIDTYGWARIKLSDCEYLVTKDDVTTAHKRSWWPNDIQGHIRTIKLIVEEIE